MTNPYAYKPAYRFGTVRNSVTAEIIEKTQPRMYEYMREFMQDNATAGIKSVKEQFSNQQYYENYKLPKNVHINTANFFKSRLKLLIKLNIHA